jgi:group I intron endonuclease
VRGQFEVKTPGIYAILNNLNGKVYIGSSSQVPIRLAAHRCALNSGTHKNPKLQRAWTKYGPDAFEFWMLQLLGKDDDHIAAEQCWLDEWRPHEDGVGYNIADRAEGGSWLGKSLPADMREKIGAAHRGMKRSPEARANMSAGRRKKIISPEQRARISAKLTGRVIPPDVRVRMAAGTKAAWDRRKARAELVGTGA